MAVIATQREPEQMYLARLTTVRSTGGITGASAPVLVERGCGSTGP